MNTTLRPGFYVPAAILLVLVSVVVTLLFASYAAPSTQLHAVAWITGISAAGVSAFVACLAYVLNRQVAIRSATIEAQKMLLEINKQYVTNPALLQVEGEDVDVADPQVKFAAQLRAMAYLKLNVFEVIFAVLPVGREREAWTSYFVSSLDKSALLEDELEKNRSIYHAALIGAFDAWRARKPARAGRG